MPLRRFGLGLGELAWFDANGRPSTTPGQTQAFVSGILLTMAGLVIAGPWLSLVGARLVARRTNRPAVLIAGFLYRGTAYDCALAGAGAEQSSNTPAMIRFRVFIVFLLTISETHLRATTSSSSCFRV